MSITNEILLSSTNQTEKKQLAFSIFDKIVRYLGIAVLIFDHFFIEFTLDYFILNDIFIL